MSEQAVEHRFMHLRAFARLATGLFLIVGGWSASIFDYFARKL